MKENTTSEKVISFEAVEPVFKALYEEFQELSRKKPDATLNTGKVAIVNRVLVDIKALVSGYPTAKYLDLLSDDALPQNSDVVLVMSQYTGALSNFKERHHGYQQSIHEHAWYIGNTLGRRS